MKQFQSIEDLRIHDLNDQELINSFQELSGVSTDDFLILNEQLFSDRENLENDLFDIDRR